MTWLIAASMIGMMMEFPPVLRLTMQSKTKVKDNMSAIIQDLDTITKRNVEIHAHAIADVIENDPFVPRGVAILFGTFPLDVSLRQPVENRVYEILSAN